MNIALKTAALLAPILAFQPADAPRPVIVAEMNPDLAHADPANRQGCMYSVGAAEFARARNDGASSLIVGYLNARLGEGEDSEAQDLSPWGPRWLEKSIDEDPLFVAEGLLNLESSGHIIDLNQWPEASRVGVPKYRMELLRLAMKTADSLGQLLVHEQERLDTMPEGGLEAPHQYPSGTAPESVHDPVERSAYEKRVAEFRAHQLQEQVVDRLRSAERELVRSFGPSLAEVVEEASAEELSAMAAEVRRHRWHDLPLFHLVAGRVPTLGSASAPKP